MIEIKRHTELDRDVRSRLEALVGEEFGHVPIVQETVWALPDWTVVHFLEGEVATFYSIVEREVTMDGQSCKVAGINNVITPRKFRGRGLSTKTLAATESFLFDELKAIAGLLLCADELVPFYRRLEWYQVACPVYVAQPGSRRKRWASNTMLRNRGEQMAPKEIDLNGLPW